MPLGRRESLSPLPACSRGTPALDNRSIPLPSSLLSLKPRRQQKTPTQQSSMNTTTATPTPMVIMFLVGRSALLIFDWPFSAAGTCHMFSYRSQIYTMSVPSNQDTEATLISSSYNSPTALRPVQPLDFNLPPHRRRFRPATQQTVSFNLSSMSSYSTDNAPTFSNLTGVSPTPRGFQPRPVPTPPHQHYRSHPTTHSPSTLHSSASGQSVHSAHAIAAPRTTYLSGGDPGRRDGRLGSDMLGSTLAFLLLRGGRRA